MSPSARILSYGGGLNSFAMLLDAVERGELPDYCVFMDVGDPERLDPGEWPDTYRHIREVVMPLCERLGVRFEWLDTTRYPVRPAQGGSRSLFAWMRERNNIPVSNPGRTCTKIAKVERFERWLEDTFPGECVEVWIGFEAGEEYRRDKDPNAGKARQAGATQRVNRFPLIERGICRCRCLELAKASGHPVPRKSACVFCPYGNKAEWRTLLRELPDTFAQVEELEAQKPPTKAGYKLTIKGWGKTAKAKRLRRGQMPVLGVHYKAPTIREYTTKGEPRTTVKVCPVCHGTKAEVPVGCGYYA